MGKDDFVKLLEILVREIKASDSFEGRVEYMQSELPGVYVVDALIRTGTSEGQGGCIMVGEDVQAARERMEQR